MHVSDQPLYRDWELLHQCDLDLDRLASLHGIKLPSNSGTDLAELLDECVAWRIVVRRQKPEETDDKYVTVLRGELSKARSPKIDAVIDQIAESNVRLRELDAALSDNRGESSENRASRVRTTWAMFQVGKQPLELSESDGPTLEEMRTDLRNVRPTLSAKAERPESWGQLQERLWLDSGAWKHHEFESRRNTPRDIEKLVSQYPPDERWPRISRWIDRELKSEEVQFDPKTVEQLKSDVADRLFFTCLRNANYWRRRGMQAHRLTDEYWGFVKGQLQTAFKSAVEWIKNGQGRGELQTEDESNSLSNVESIPASDEFSAILTTDEIEVLINKAAPTKSSGSKKRRSGKKGKRTGRKSPADNLRLTKDEWRLIEQLRKSDDRQTNAKELGMTLAKYDRLKHKAMEKLEELGGQAGWRERRQD